MLTTLLHPILGLRGWEAYAVVASLCFGEAGLLVGFFLPGETAVVLGGVLAALGHVSLVVMLVVVVLSAILGDTLGYFLGRRFGPTLLQHRPLKGRPGVEKARAFVERRGSTAVFIGRFTAVFRALVPGVAGMSSVPYLRFAVANAAGGLIWGVAYTLAGWAVGRSYERVLHDGNVVSDVIIGVAAAALVVVLVLRRRREHRGLGATDADGTPDTAATPATPGTKAES